MNSLKFAVLPSENIPLPENELAARLKTPLRLFPPEVYEAADELRSHMECKAAYKEEPFELIGEDTVSFSFGKVKSASLSAFLRRSESCVFTAMTLGMGVERFLNSIPEDLASKKLLCDAAASAFTEGACDTLQKLIAAEYRRVTGRFSPGYGDLSLDFQPILLKELNAARLLGITLNDSFLMIPRKSVSAIVGVKK